MCHLKIHRRLAVCFGRLPADHHGREPRQPGGVGEGVQVLLVGLSNAKNTMVAPLPVNPASASGVALYASNNPPGVNPPFGTSSGRNARAGRAMRGVAHDPAQSRDDIAQRRGHGGLLRRCVEHLPLAAPVVVHRHREGARHACGGTLDDRPVRRRVASAPIGRSAPPTRSAPSGRSESASVTVSCASPAARRAQIGGAGQQRRVRTSDEPPGWQAQAAFCCDRKDADDDQTSSRQPVLLPDRSKLERISGFLLTYVVDVRPRSTARC